MSVQVEIEWDKAAHVHAHKQLITLKTEIANTASYTNHTQADDIHRSLKSIKDVKHFRFFSSTEDEPDHWKRDIEFTINNKTYKDLEGDIRLGGNGEYYVSFKARYADPTNWSSDNALSDSARKRLSALLEEDLIKLAVEHQEALKEAYSAYYLKNLKEAALKEREHAETMLRTLEAL